VAGASALKAISDLIERRATLTDVRRQTVDWQRAASVAMARGDSEAGLRAYAAHDCLEMVAGNEAAQAHSIKAWQELRQTHGDDVIVVTRRNRDAVALNLVAREVLRKEGHLEGADINLTTVDRDGSLAQLPLAMGDSIRFGETLHKHQIRSGTRGSVDGYSLRADGSVHLTIRLEDGRVIQDAWSGFTQPWRRRHAGIPKIVHAIAGSAYSVQGRTSLAAVYHIASATDSRETYLALTRHRHDVRIVVESERLEADCRARQEDPRMLSTRFALQERLFTEARRYNEKANVVDYVGDRTKFIETGNVELPRPQTGSGIVLVVEAARRLELATRSVKLNGGRLVDELLRRAISVVPDTRLNETTRTILEKVRAWARTPQTKPGYFLRSTAFEYDR
jgi:hypothetical protein